MSDAGIKLTDDGKTVLITFPGVRPVEVSLNTGEVDRMIETLGDLRQRMLPQVPPTYALGQAGVVSVMDPAWSTEFGGLKGEWSIIHIKDPRYGWIHFALPKPSARRLATFLMEQTRGVSGTH